MKILYFVPPGPHARKFVRTFGEKHDVHAVTQFHPAEPGWEWLGTRSRVSRWRTRDNARRLRRVVDRWKPDLVHAFHLLPSATIAVAARIRPLVISAMGADIYLSGGQVSPLGEAVHLTPVPRMWHARIRGSFDLALVECEDARRRMAALGYPAEKVRAIPWGPDCGVFSPSARDEETRGRLLDGGFDSVVVCARQHRAVYGVEEVVRVLPLLPGRTVLALAGDGPQTPKLRRLAAKLGVERRIKWLGNLPDERMPSLYASADCTVSLARSDTVSVCVLEAMACGIPAVVRATGGTAEFLTDGRSGAILADASPARVASELTRLLEDPDSAKRKGRAAREEVLEKADWRKCAPLIEEAYAAVARA